MYMLMFCCSSCLVFGCCSVYCLSENNTSVHIYFTITVLLLVVEFDDWLNMKTMLIHHHIMKYSDFIEVVLIPCFIYFRKNLSTMTLIWKWNDFFPFCTFAKYPCKPCSYETFYQMSVRWDCQAPMSENE